jgi:hypothetical protein
LTNRNKLARFGGAFASSVALALLVLTVPLPSALRPLILAGVTAAWTVAACRWAVRRFGKTAIFVVVVAPLALLGMIGRAWWMDRPNRQLLARIDKLPGISAATNGTFFVGEVDHVYIGPNATDADVRRFTELEGLDGIRTLIINQARVSDGTARRFGRFTSLRHLVFQGTDVSDEVLVELERELSQCQIEVMEAR